jgi:hypothetical protein
VIDEVNHPTAYGGRRRKAAEVTALLHGDSLRKTKRNVRIMKLFFCLSFAHNAAVPKPTGSNKNKKLSFAI